MKAEHTAKPDAHIGIAAEVIIDLQRVGDQSQCGRRSANRRFTVEHAIGNDCHCVGKQNFFEKTDHKALDAVGKIVPRFFAVLDFIRNRLIAHDRACDQLREQGNIETHIQRIFLYLSVTAIYIEHIGHRLERKERNPDRQRNGRYRKCRTEKSVDIVQCKHQIFEHKQKA